MEAANPSNLLKMINEKWSVDYFLNISKERLSSAAESSGIKSTNMLSNMATFLFLGGMAIVSLVVLWLLTLCKSVFQEILLDKFNQLKKKMFFNGTIKGKTIAYLKTTISFSLIYHTIDFNAPIKVLYPQMLSAFMVLGYPVMVFFILTCCRHRLHEPAWRGKIGSFYNGVNINKSPTSILYYPLFLLRRLTFVCLPIVFDGHEWHQIQTLIFVNLFFTMYYYNVQPHTERSRRLVEMFNEFMIVILSYHLMTFTHFLNDVSTQFIMGYSFIFALCLVLFSNVAYMIKNQITRGLIARK